MESASSALCVADHGRPGERLASFSNRRPSLVGTSTRLQYQGLSSASASWRSVPLWMGWSPSGRGRGHPRRDSTRLERRVRGGTLSPSRRLADWPVLDGEMGAGTGPTPVAYRAC